MDIPMNRTVCVIVGSWPRVSTTFIAQELVGLEQQGLRLWLVALKSGDPVRHSLHDQLKAAVYHPTRYPPIRPAELLRAWSKVRRLPGYVKARALFHTDRTWLSLSRRLHLFTQAILIAEVMPSDTKMIYVHFLHKPATVARYVAALTQLALGGSAHARDVWVTSDAEKRAKLDAMDWTTTCNGPAFHKLRSLTDDPAKVRLIYHGLSLSRFPALPPVRPRRDGSHPDNPVLLLSVGRAVEKKGFDVLLEALAALPAGVHWRWHHVGTGKIIDELKRHAERLNLTNKIVWHGMQSQAVVIDQYRLSDLFVFPARQASDGDQDGLPNVLMEAQTQALACLSTSFSAIPELILNGETGVLVPPAAMKPLCDALNHLITSPAERERLGRAGYVRVREHFRAESGIQTIGELLNESLAR